MVTRYQVVITETTRHIHSKTAEHCREHIVRCESQLYQKVNVHNTEEEGESLRDAISMFKSISLATYVDFASSSFIST